MHQILSYAISLIPKEEGILSSVLQIFIGYFSHLTSMNTSSPATGMATEEAQAQYLSTCDTLQKHKSFKEQGRPDSGSTFSKCRGRGSGFFQMRQAEEMERIDYGKKSPTTASRTEPPAGCVIPYDTRQTVHRWTCTENMRDTTSIDVAPMEGKEMPRQRSILKDHQ